MCGHIDDGAHLGQSPELADLAVDDEPISQRAQARRVGAQADPLLVRQTNEPTIDAAKARAAVTRYVNDAGYQLDVFDLQGNTLTIEVSGTIDYVFPTTLQSSITGRAETTLRAGVVTEGG